MLQRVMLVAQKCDANLQGFTQDDSNACDLMDDEQHNPPRLVWHTILLLLLKVRDDSEQIIFEPGGHFNHVEPAGVANER